MELHQHTSAPASGGYWPRADRGRLRLSGRDALSFLQALISNDVEALEVGGACDAVYLTPQGRMIADLRVFRRADDIVVSVPAELASSLAARFDSLVFSEDVLIEDVSDAVTHYSIVDGAGSAREVVGEPAPTDLSQLSADEAERRRIEAGAPKWGVDMNADTIPLEAGLLDRAISQTKGCYVGQEVIIRVLHRGGGRVAKRLMKINLESGANVPEPGTPIEADGVSVGAITSAVFSPRVNAPIALGYVKRDHAEPGVDVRVGGASATLGVPAS